MASTWSNLKIQLMGNGDNTGTWGEVTNANLGTAIEEAIVGSSTVNYTGTANETLLLADTTASQPARNLRLNLTGSTGGSAGTLTVPAIEKVYIINNAMAEAITVQNSTGAGMTVPAGKTMYVYNNGTNVVDAITHLRTLTLGAPLAVTSGGTGSAATAYCSLTTNVTGTLPVANGGTGGSTAVVARANILPSYVGHAADILQVNSGGTDVEWVPVSAGGVTSVTGTAGRITTAGSTTVSVDLATTAVTAGTYTATNLTVDAYGRITAAANGSSGGSGVTSVGGTGTVNGITLSGLVTSTGNLTLGGALSGVSLTTQVTGTLPVGNGGTGATTLAGAGIGTLSGTQTFTGAKTFTGGITSQAFNFAANSSIYGTGGGLIADVAVNNGSVFTFSVSNNTSSVNLVPNPDNSRALGAGALRWTVVYATTGTINTSDANEKQDIEALNAAEQRVAVRIKAGIKKFRWKDAVVAKGEDARIHVGVIAQEVAAAFTAEGLDPYSYGMFCFDRWYDREETFENPDGSPYTRTVCHSDPVAGGTMRERFGVRYEELLAFVISAM